MRKLMTATLAGLMLLPLAACGGKGGAMGSAKSDPFHSDVSGGDVQWVYWPGKKGSVAMWLVPVNNQDPLLTVTCVKDGWKLNVRGYIFQSYAGQSGPVSFMDLEAGGVKLHGRNSWAPTGDIPIARGDLRVTADQLKTITASGKITVSVNDEHYTFDGFGKAGKKFPQACATALGVS